MDGVVGVFFFTAAALTTTGVGGELPVVEEEEEGLDMGCFLIDADPPAPMDFEEGGVVIGFFTGVVTVAGFTGVPPVTGVLEGNFLESGLTGVVVFLFADSLSTICIGDMV